MIKRLTLITALLAALGASAQSASANQLNAPDSLLVTAVCSGHTYQFVVNGNGTFTPGHVVGSSQEFVPTAFELNFTLTDPSGSTSTSSAGAVKPHAPNGHPIVTCGIPAALNTTASPEGTFVVDGYVSGYFA